MEMTGADPFRDPAGHFLFGPVLRVAVLSYSVLFSSP